MSRPRMPQRCALPCLASLALLGAACSAPPASGSSSTTGGSSSTSGSASTSASSTSSASSSASSSTGGASTSTGSSGTGSSAGSTSGSTSSTGSTGVAWWRPGTGALPWQWELSHELVTTDAADMGTNGQTYNGGAPAAPAVYDLDGFDTTASDVAALHALGKKVICYIEVGALESYRPDAAQFPAQAQGHSVPDYPDEKYLDITSPAVVALIEARIDMCQQKGFDGVEPDIDDSYTDSTGFPISEAQNVAYLHTLADHAHARGLAWGLKNGGDGGTPTQFVADVLPFIDFAVVEEPYFLGTIGYFEPALAQAGVALFVAEYTNDTASASSFCPQALADGANAALFDVNLDASTRVACQ